MNPVGLGRVVALALLVALSFNSVALGVPTKASTPSCSDSMAGPVLLDYGWRLLNQSYNYSDFATKYVEPSVIISHGTYVLYVREQLNGSALFGIFRGTSTDGVNWNMSKVPVLSVGANGAWDSRVVFSPDVVWNGTGYMMYYVGDGPTGANYPANFRQIGVAFSADGIQWKKYAGNPIIAHGPGTYDARYTRGPSAIIDNGTYKMWYTGTRALNASLPYITAIDYATSVDGVHWMKYPGNPVFTGFHLQNGTVDQAYWPSVVKAGGIFLMAFADGIANIGFATSQDGISWAFDNQTNIFLTTSGWHNGFIGNPSLLLEGQNLHLWYYGSDNSAQTSPYVAGVGFAHCGALVVPFPTTTTQSLTSTRSVSVTVSVTQTAIITSTQTTSSIFTSTTVNNPDLPAFQAAESFAAGIVVAMIVAVTLVWRKVRTATPSRT